MLCFSRVQKRLHGSEGVIDYDRPFRGLPGRLPSILQDDFHIRLKQLAWKDVMEAVDTFTYPFENSRNLLHMQLHEDMDWMNQLLKAYGLST